MWSLVAALRTSGQDGVWWGVVDWLEKFAGWELVASFVATLLATGLGVWAAISHENRRARDRERQRRIRLGLALVEEAERYPYEGPVDDGLAKTAAFPLWATRRQIASDLNENTPALGASMLFQLLPLHLPGSPDSPESAEDGNLEGKVRGRAHLDQGSDAFVDRLLRSGGFWGDSGAGGSARDDETVLFECGAPSPQSPAPRRSRGRSAARWGDVLRSPEEPGSDRSAVQLSPRLSWGRWWPPASSECPGGLRRGGRGAAAPCSQGVRSDPQCQGDSGALQQVALRLKG